MGRLCGGAHEISGIKAPIFLCGWGGWWWGGWGWVGVAVVGWGGGGGYQWGGRVGGGGGGVGVVGWVVVRCIGVGW